MDKEAILSLIGNGTGESITTETLESYGLGGIDCPVCENRGYVIAINKDGVLGTRECSCMNQRRSIRAIRTSGMEDMISRYTFDNYETPDKERQELKAAALDFCNRDTGWFYIAGKSGSGKTHLCTAICAELIKRNKRTQYMLWRDESVKLKSGVNDRQWYEARIKKLKTVPVLYIDDFWKSRRSEDHVRVTDADVNLAFEILNTRYNDSSLRTIISTEMALPEVLDIDEATGSRIYERSRGFVKKAPSENWRLR